MKLTAAEAKQLGLFKDQPTPKRKSKKAVPSRECADTWCVACGEVFTTVAAEDKHFASNPTHRRYESVLSERNRT